MTKPEFIQTVQKQHKVLAFPPISAKFASIVCGASPETQAILAQNVNGEDGDHGLSMEAQATMKAALQPGSTEVDDMNRSMIGHIAKALDALQPGTKIGMYTWLRDNITAATTRSVYGPMNPYDDNTIIDAFW